MKQGSNSFLSTLQKHRGGALLTEASEAMSKVVAAVALTGKGGTLTITLKVKPATRGNSAVVLGDEIKTKEPKMQAMESFWFATPDGELAKDDPRQTQMALSVVEGTAASPEFTGPKVAVQ